MIRTDVPPKRGANPVVRQFIEAFLIPSEAKSPDAIRARLLYWTERANNPAHYSPEQSKTATGKERLDAISNVRRKAVQNIRRTVAKYPAIAEQLRREQVAR